MVIAFCVFCYSSAVIIYGNVIEWCVLSFGLKLIRFVRKTFFAVPMALIVRKTYFVIPIFPPSNEAMLPFQDSASNDLT